MSGELLPQLETQLTQLSRIEKANLTFSNEIKKKLAERVPELSELPLIYIGSGGDVLTPLLISRSHKIILIDRHPFLTKDGSKHENSETYPSVEEMLKDVRPANERAGVLTIWSSVRPAVQMLSHLEKIGVSREQVEIQTDGKNADLRIQLGEQVVEVKFRSDRVNSLSELESLLTELGVEGEYGLMAKGGAGEAVQTIITHAQEAVDHSPRYFVVDDPRSYVLQTLTPQQEEALYPGYELTETKSMEDAGWGYSYGEEPDSPTAAQEDAFDYQTRAVIGVLK